MLRTCRASERYRRRLYLQTRLRPLGLHHPEGATEELTDLSVVSHRPWRRGLRFMAGAHYLYRLWERCPLLPVRREELSVPQVNQLDERSQQFLDVGPAPAGGIHRAVQSTTDGQATNEGDKPTDPYPGAPVAGVPEVYPVCGCKI